MAKLRHGFDIHSIAVLVQFATQNMDKSSAKLSLAQRVKLRQGLALAPGSIPLPRQRLHKIETKRSREHVWAYPHNLAGF
jgi:hypothetical protein